jgi:hypothetical protein
VVPDVVRTSACLTSGLTTVVRALDQGEPAGGGLPPGSAVVQPSAAALPDLAHPNTRLPAFQVPMTWPSTARPSKGVFWALPGIRPASIFHARSG